MSKLTITIDGQETQVDPGATILDAAKSLGIDIPTLCHHPELKPFGSCFLCVVEVEGRPNLAPSCATPVMDKMKVATRSENVRGARKMCLELLLSDHLGDCLGPCMSECPCHIDIPGFLAALREGDTAAAESLIKQSLPLPGSLGRVCPRPCESACRRQAVDKPIAICQLKRFASDPQLGKDTQYTPAVASSTGKSVGVVGAGPAGLAAAYFLRMQGHAVTVYEMHDRPGGMIRWGIPAFRLPRNVIDMEVEGIRKMGVEFRYGTALGRDVQLADLRKKHEAIFLGIGAQRASKLGCEGEDLPGVLSAIDYLHDASAGTRTTIGGRVMVVGGGNTAIDAARTSVRLGARKVFILYRRSRAEMPAFDYEIHEAEEEGVEIQILAAPLEVEKRGDGLAVHCIKMDLGEPDASGRRRPIPRKGSDYVIEVDNVIAAIGQGVDASGLGKDGPALTKWGTIVVDAKTGRTSLPDVFAGGDGVLGPDIAVRAAAGGKLAAMSIGQFLGGEEVVGDPFVFNATMGGWKDAPREIFASAKPGDRASMPLVEMEERKATFNEVELGLAPEDGKAEADRCLACGCRAANTCTVRKWASEYGVDMHRFAGAHRDWTVDDTHPDMLFEPGKCVLCGICVRMCDEVLGVPAMGFVGRGFATRISPPLRRSLKDVDFKGMVKLVDACPTGALTLKRVRVAVLEVAPRAGCR